MFHQAARRVRHAPSHPLEVFTDADKAVDRLIEIFESNTAFLRQHFQDLLEGKEIDGRVRAFYPQVRIVTDSHIRLDSRLSYGFVSRPGTHASTITRPDLFRHYLVSQLSLLMKNHDVPIQVGDSDMPIPLHFAFYDGTHVEGGAAAANLDRPLADMFDLPDLTVMDDSIANGTYDPADGVMPLASFTAPRVDYSLHRLQHYTATKAEHFQNYVLFTNYQFYIDEFCRMSRELLSQPDSGYEAFVSPGNVVLEAGQSQPDGEELTKLPQMPAYHLKRADGSGITMVNIGVGPSNAKTITDHIAVLRPHVWLMLGHCAGLRNSQTLGDYVLAHGYVREDNVLDQDLPIWVPIPPLAEVQVALEDAVAEITGIDGYELKRVMRTGTVVSLDNRNWELWDQPELVKRFSQSRAIALDMESATIAANGFRFRVPYGTLLCISDKPLHGELKLPGMATDFYKRQVAQHLQIGIRAMEKMRDMTAERLHSRKLRSFAETAFQ
ncbi:AMP nucleosidase [Roseibium sp. FZY0029]|uniref:AMP nucleosidase n=1 Tax=Roseibium sp. FZY0029 TaxID=3116647 RepID=UPI002EBF9AF1|nr:AMP nucleosidase [Roseibium sp. FZY0029]